MKTGVFIHGYHLQAKNWEKIAWGEPPGSLGRLPKGVLVALEEKAELVILGSGESEIDGKKEGEYSRSYLFEHFFDLARFSAFRKVNLAWAKRKIESIIKIEIRSKNTLQELMFGSQMFKEAGIKKIILVSSPAHVPRCLRDGLIVFGDDYDISVRHSQTSFTEVSEVIIIEPSHRPDQLKSNIHGFVKKLMAMSGKEQEEIIKKALG